MHLSDQQLSAWVIGQRSPQLNRHVAGCESCRQEIANLERVISAFRSTIRDVSGMGNEQAIYIPSARTSSFRWMMACSWAAVAFVLCFFLANRGRTLSPAAKPGSALEITDAALLQQVDNELSELVPAPMQPLSGLRSRVIQVQ